MTGTKSSSLNSKTHIYTLPSLMPDRKYMIIGTGLLVFLGSLAGWLISGIVSVWKPAVISRDRSKLGLFVDGTELRTDPDCVMLYTNGCCTSSIPRDRLHTSIMTFGHGEFYVVFSTEEIENATRDELMDLVRTKKAFAFPEDLWMREHEPSFFHC